MNVFFIEKATDGTIGGSHTCLHNLVRNLDWSEFKIFVGFYQDNPYVKIFREMGITVCLIERKPFTGRNALLRKIGNWYRLVYKHGKELNDIVTKNQIDLVVINNSILDSNDIVRICNKNKIPVITYERGYIQYKQSDIELAKNIFASIPVSYAIKDNMERQNYHSKSRVIYDGLQVEKLESRVDDSKKKTVKRSLGIPEDGIVIGIIGNIREWKGQEYFVRAVLSLGRKYENLYGLVIGGYGTEDLDYVDHVKSIAEGAGAGNRILFLGYRNDVDDLLKIMDVFVHASIKPEPFGMVILEAMASRVPVIATNIGGPLESLYNGHCGILAPPRDADALAEGIEKYLHDPDFRNQMVARAYERVLDQFDLRLTVHQVEDLFKEAVASAKIS